MKDSNVKEGSKEKINHFSMNDLSVSGIVSVVIGLVLVLVSFVLTNEEYMLGARAFGILAFAFGAMRIFIFSLNSKKAIIVFISFIIALYLLSALM